MISVICASPPLPNPGMSAVDLAFPAILRRHRIQVDVRYFRLYTPDERNVNMPAQKRKAMTVRQAIPISYDSLRGGPEQLYGSDAIIFWGDFIHARDYLNQVESMLLENGIAANPAQASELLYRSFFLAGAPEDVLARTLSFGGTLIFNRQRDYRDAAYSANLSRFLESCRHVWMRDLYSANQVGRLLGRPLTDFLGVDCALLLGEDDVALLPQSNFYSGADAAPAAGIFFGRTQYTVDALAGFTQDLCRALSVTGEWLPWFDQEFLPNHLPRTAAIFEGMHVPGLSSPPRVGDLLKRLAKYSFIVTDTYHVAVNGWRAGVPVVCIGDALNVDNRIDCSVGWPGAWRDKRFSFYAMYDAMDYFLFAEELMRYAGRKHRLANTVEALRDNVTIGKIVETLRGDAGKAEHEFIGELGKALLSSRTRAETGLQSF